MYVVTNDGLSDGRLIVTTGEDYFMYHVPADSPRPDAGKWLLLPWDLDESYTDDNDALIFGARRVYRWAAGGVGQMAGACRGAWRPCHPGEDH